MRQFASCFSIVFSDAGAVLGLTSLSSSPLLDLCAAFEATIFGWLLVAEGAALQVLWVRLVRFKLSREEHHEDYSLLGVPRTYLWKRVVHHRVKLKGLAVLVLCSDRWRGSRSRVNFRYSPGVD